MKAEQITFQFMTALVDELARAGVKQVCIAPGSRSTPLAMTFAARQHDFNLWVDLDERSAAFFALGMAKTNSQPVVLVCTSGTAAANFYPAVIEAYYARIPLVVLTADRPKELHEVGAAQTINQNHLYGQHVKWFHEVPAPEATPDMLRYIRATINRAVGMSLEAPAGPVHLNFLLREPLVPLPSSEIILEPRTGTVPYTRLLAGHRMLDASMMHQAATWLHQYPRGVIVCGNAYRYEPSFAEAVVELAAQLHYPILADPLSGLRYGAHAHEQILESYDAFLRDQRVVDSLKPDIILRFGALPTSKPLLQYMQRHTEAAMLVVDGGSAWNDPTQQAMLMIHADARRFSEALADLLSGDDSTQLDPRWLPRWLKLEQRTQQAIGRQIQRFDKLFEGRVFTELSTLLPDEAILYTSSSMPVRDMDTFLRGSTTAVQCLSNRGANGIDGVVSSALGAAAVHHGRVVLVIGDVAFFHDMNGLLMAKLYNIPLTIILIHNDGGGIFSFLPQAAHPDHFELLFGTPHGLDFQHTAALYDAHYERVKSWDAFHAAVKNSFSAPKLHLIELRTDRALNVQMHRQIWAAVATIVDEQGD